MRSVQKTSCHVMWKIETFIEEDTRYKKHCTQGNDASVPFKVGILGPHTVLPVAIAAPLYFPESHWWSAISPLSKVILVLGKARSHRAPNLGCRGAESPGDLMFHQKTLHERCDAWVGVLSCCNCQSPVACSCGLLNHLNSFWREMFKLNTKFDANSLLYLLSHFKCDGHTVHMLTQRCLPPPLTSTVKSSLFTHAHSTPLSLAARLHQCLANHSCYINNGWTFSRQPL